MIGKMISHYKILSEIGSGGMGVVYKAQDTRLDRIVALKFLPVQSSLSQEDKKRFIHEAKAAASLDHSNICSVFDFGETEDGRMFMVMPCYQGHNLKDKIASSPLPISEAIDITIQIAHGLNEAHKKNIVHRDIKSANIFITDKGEVKILDFGVAKLKGRTQLTKEDSTFGTIDYMSPEQASGAKVDHRSDIWSLGVVLYEMVTGQLPFKGEYEQSVIYSIMNEQPKPITGLRSGVPLELEQIVNKSLAKEPSERYQHVDDLLVDLKKIQKEFQPGVIPEKKKTRPEITIRKPRRIILTAGLIIIAILVAVQLLWKPFFKKEINPREKIGIAVVYFENRTQDKNLDHLKVVIPDLLITSLEQSKYFSVMTWERMRDLLKQMGREQVEFIDKDLGIELCHREGIKTMVMGSYTRLGNTYATDVKVLDVETKALLKSAMSKGRGEQSILDSQIDELARDISQVAGLSRHEINQNMKPVREVTTDSLEAYKYYIWGREEIGRDKKKAIEYLKKAVDIDPDFALAYSELGFSYFLDGYDEYAIQAIRRAKALSERVNERERLWIDFYSAALEKNTQKERLSNLKKITREYPKDKMGHFWLGAWYKVTGMYDEGIAATERALELDPTYSIGLSGLMWIYYYSGQFDKALEMTKKMIQVNPGNSQDYTIGTIYFALGNLNKAIETYKNLSKFNPYSGQIQIAHIEALQENYSGTLKRVDQYINSVPSKYGKAYGYYWKGLYDYWLGRLQLSINDLNLAAKILDDISEKEEVKNLQGVIELLKGWVLSGKGDSESARISLDNWYNIYKKVFAVDESTYEDVDVNFLYHCFQLFFHLKYDQIQSIKSRLNKLSSEIPTRLIRLKELTTYWTHLLTAEVFIKEKKPEYAIRECKKSRLAQIPFISQLFYSHIYNLPYIHDTLARAYAQKGDLNNAIKEYEKLTIFNPASNDRRLIHPLYHYRLAKLYQKKGLKQKATTSYNKFISFWKDCDPEFQYLVIDARKRVEDLAK